MSDIEKMNDWSLKEVGYLVDNDKERELVLQFKKDISILREKLIDDIGSYPLPPYDDVVSDNSVRMDLIRLINKRFGID